MKPCPNCHVMIPTESTRCPNCGAGIYVPPLPGPSASFTGRSWLDLLLGLALSLFAPGAMGGILQAFHVPPGVTGTLPCLWWLGTVVAYFMLRRRHRDFSIGLLIGVLFWLISGLLLLLLVLGVLLLCSSMLKH